ncbi:site-specific DNA-methyltransferase [Salmonella enterica subsp. enterica serovar London]|uniref:Methyltransferase n=2 Tax=Salmonella enterica subsp. salamae TaxID=59202 RepID=A0A5Y3MM39_SALER|nr:MULTISPECIES: site-specific DNA-methyltransferase [Enterobacteriaceae]EAO9707282.1 site-specific DNA-methyltransferase [Salmonella enterica]EBI0478772.1 site-specific DNA-methyltransferase [Salmonella enterica subsp. enterica serovar Braenderup]ECI4008113.1 site-specific DNA-methyltransferase [Salmonella enterica subsp. salamae]EIR0424140.1 site-specific DNA-methyltransferase [Salmonella enterica subsp. enterica serovar London]HAE4962939.1 site-specific DNA-methyltransferase [Salmonella ent
MQNELYRTKMGRLFVGDSVSLSQKYLNRHYKNKFNLIITSPPFPLNNKKKYGNLQGEAYYDWFISLAPIFSNLLTDDGSLVIEIGNSWESGRPIQSLLHLECLLGLVKNPNSDLRLIQEFICYNPSRLPSPAQWVTVNRIRTVDSYTHVWWISKSDFPKANNAKVLRPYSKEMENLIKRKKYNAGKRPSEHGISPTAFFRDNGGSIPHNLFELDAIDASRDVRLPHNILSYSNTTSNDYYFKRCREKNISPHPARMHGGLINFFIDFLTDEGDLVLDPFAGSNTTGYCAEKLNRRWISIEANKSYALDSMIRFEDPELNTKIKLFEI